MTGTGEQVTNGRNGTNGSGAARRHDLRCDQTGCADRTFTPAGRLVADRMAVAVPARPLPDRAGPDRAAPDGAAPDGAAPDGAAPDGAAPDGAVSGQAVSDRAGSDGAESDGAGTWSSFVRVHNVACRRIETALVRRHELTLASYDVLRVLAMEPDGRFRMTELAEHVVLSRSGTSRVVDGLEHQGLVRRQVVDDDLRGFYAVLTERGRQRFAAAEVTHRAAVDTHVLSCLEPSERRSLRDVLGHIAGALGPGIDGRTAGSRTARPELDSAGSHERRS